MQAKSTIQFKLDPNKEYKCPKEDYCHNRCDNQFRILSHHLRRYFVFVMSLSLLCSAVWESLLTRHALRRQA